VILPGGGYAPSTRVRPGTPPAEPAGASSANQATCPRCYRQPPQTGNRRATINQEEVTHGQHHRRT
jgi:hypothetical protein